MENLNKKIKEILKQHKEGRPFFDALDFSIKGDYDLLEILINKTLPTINNSYSKGLLLTEEKNR